MNLTNILVINLTLLKQVKYFNSDLSYIKFLNKKNENPILRNFNSQSFPEDKPN